MENTNKNDIFILIRHGERIDRVGLEPTFHVNDPELTEKGKKQAFEIGEILSDYLSKHFPNHSEIKIISSPFSRTIQTSLNIMKGLKKNLQLNDLIYLNYHFCEIIIDDFFEHHDIDKFLVIKNEMTKLEKDISNAELIFMNSFDQLNLLDFETGLTCKERLYKGLKEIVNNNLNGEYDSINIIVSHAGPIDLLNNHLGYPGESGWENIKFCHSFIFIHENFVNDELKFNFLESFYPNIS